MPSPEQGGHHPERERTEPPYHQAARFAGEQPAGRAYQQAQAAIYRTDCDLSTYRLQVNQVWHVAVLGETPPQDLAEELQAILAAGAPATLPREVLTMLVERRKQATKLGPWVERHYRQRKQR